MRLTEEQIERARESSARAARAKSGQMSHAVAEHTERRFAERRKRDAAQAMMLGLSADFVVNEIPAYVRGERPRG